MNMYLDGDIEREIHGFTGKWYVRGGELFIESFTSIEFVPMREMYNKTFLWMTRTKSRVTGIHKSPRSPKFISENNILDIEVCG